MQLKDVMTKNPKVLPVNATVRDAAKLMKEIDSGIVPVIENNRLAGVVTDRDIVTRLIAEDRSPNDTRVEKVMTDKVYFCYEDQDVKDAAKLMSEKQVRRIPIVNRQHELVGIISMGDLAVDVNKDKLTGQTLEDVSKPAKPDR